MGGGLTALGVVAAIVAWVLWWDVRRRAVRIEQGTAAIEERVHRLQRLALVGTFGMLLIYALGIAALVGVFAHSDDTPAAEVVVALVAELALVLALPMTGRAVRRALARVRDVAVKPPNQRRALLITLPVMVGMVALLGVAFAFAPDNGLGRAATFLVVYAALLVIMQLVVGPLLFLKLRGRPLPAPLVERLDRLAGEMGIATPKLRAFTGRQQKVANAAQVGLLPGLRYVAISDYLIDNVSEREVDAVVAHEFGHARGRHLAIKFGAILACAASAAVAADVLTSALGQVAELNHTKRDTGRGWAVVTQHPGLDDRIARLSKRNDAGVPAGVG